MRTGSTRDSRKAPIAIAVVVATAVGMFAAAPVASAATISAGPQAASFNYLTPNVSISAGESLEFQNLDVVSHDVTSKDTYRPKRKKGQKRRPPPQLLFRTDLIGFGETAPVSGAERLKPGRSYPFFCSLHPSMSGTVTVN